MGEYVRAELELLPLDKLHISFHALCRKFLRKQVRDIPVRVQTAELQRQRGRRKQKKTKKSSTGRRTGTHRDELPHKPELPELPHKFLHIFFSEAGGIPVEARTQIVRQPLVRVRLVHAIGKFARLRKDRLLRLHPQQIRVGRERDCAVYRALGAALISIVPLDCAWRVPVPERCAMETKFSLCDGECFSV